MSTEEKQEQEQAFRKRCSLLTDKELVRQMWLLGLVGDMEADMITMSEALGEPVPPNPNPPVLGLADLQEILRAELKNRTLAKSGGMP